MLKTNSEEETKEFAVRFAKELKAGDVLALVGELGSGKTSFVRGLAKGLDVPQKTSVTSPTFVLIHEYWGGLLPLYHFDFYRLEKIEDALALYVEEYWEGKGVSVVEWADRFPTLFPERTRWIRFRFLGETTREIQCSSFKNTEGLPSAI